ncbi:MAG: hypothetical protein WCH11_02345 [Bdellovibrio sp.]
MSTNSPFKDPDKITSSRIDIHSTESSYPGLTGLFEKALRRFKVLMHLATMAPVYLLFVSVLGIALAPALFWVHQFWLASAAWSSFARYFAWGLGLSTAYLVYGISLMLLVAGVNKILRLQLSSWRGPYYSAETLRWFLHNGLTYLVRFTFLEMVTPSPLNIWYFRMMGMKIGKSCTINSSWISDPSLIEMGDHVTVGGSVTLVAHYGQGGLLVFSPVKIGSNVTLGLKSTIMGGVVLEDSCKILPNSVVLPKTRVPAGETWGGVPAGKINLSDLEGLGRNKAS